MLGVGTVALVSHAAGRKDQPEANLHLQSVGADVSDPGCPHSWPVYALTGVYVHSVAADAAFGSRRHHSILYWYLPGLALQFALVAMGSALRGTGIVQPTMVVQVLTVVLNTIFAPVLIAGWGTHHPWASPVPGSPPRSPSPSVSCSCGSTSIASRTSSRCTRSNGFPTLPPGDRILNIGLPAGGEILMIFVFIGGAYWAIRDFGPAAQAGFGVGSRLMQAIFLPAMAIAFAAAPVAGQNFGAGHSSRASGETFRSAALVSSVVMVALTLFCQWRPEVLIGAFSRDPAVIAVGAPYLQIISWNFVATGLIFTCSSLFQALGNTWPSLLSSASRLVTFAMPAVWLGSRGHFELRHLWYLSVCTVALQALLSLSLLQREFRKRLPARSPGAAGRAEAAEA